MKLHHIALVCSTIENADQFYRDILGLQKIKTATLSRELVMQIFGIDLECKMVTYTNESIAIEMFTGPTLPVKTRSLEHLCIQVDNKEHFLRDCESKGVYVLRVPKGGNTVSFIKDFDGNMIEVKDT